MKRAPLYYAIKNNRLDAAGLLIESGANIHAGFRDETALHMAVSEGNINAVLLLIKYGADVNRREGDNTHKR